MPVQAALLESVGSSFRSPDHFAGFGRLVPRVLYPLAVDAGEFWQRRFEQYDTQARTLFSRTVELVSIALTVVIGVTGFAVSYGHYETLAFVAPVVLLIWAVAARLIHEQMLLFAYRDYAEVRVARELGVETDPLATWRKTAGRPTQNGFVNAYAYSVLAAVSIAMIAGSLIAAFVLGPVPIWIIAPESVIVGLALGLGVFAFAQALRDHKRVDQMIP